MHESIKSKTKSHLGQGSNRGEIRDLITLGSGTKSICVCASVTMCMSPF